MYILFYFPCSHSILVLLSSLSTQTQLTYSLVSPVSHCLPAGETFACQGSNTTTSNWLCFHTLSAKVWVIAQGQEPDTGSGKHFLPAACSPCTVMLAWHESLQLKFVLRFGNIFHFISKCILSVSTHRKQTKTKTMIFPIDTGKRASHICQCSVKDRILVSNTTVTLL